MHLQCLTQLVLLVDDTRICGWCLQQPAPQTQPVIPVWATGSVTMISICQELVHMTRETAVHPLAGSTRSLRAAVQVSCMST